MKPKPTKAQIRAELEKQMQEYLQKGGAVSDIPRGVSGHEDNSNPFSKTSSDNAPRQERTPLNDVVKALDERKQNKRAPTARPKGPRKKLIVDDFGEPLRWVWVED